MTEGRPAVRVLHLLLWIVPGGGGTQSYRRALLDAFAGVADVRMLGAAVQPGVADAGFAEPPHVGRAGDGRWRNWASFFRHVWRAAPQVDVVQIHGLHGPQFLLGATLAALRGVPYIVNPHGALSPWFLARPGARKRLFFATAGAELLRRAACVLATCEPERDFIARRFPRVRVAMARVGVAVPPQPDSALEAESRAGTLQILYLGTFDEWKRVPLLLRAVAALRAGGIDAQVTLCGQGPPALEAAARREIARLGLGEAATLAGYVTGADKADCLRRAHVLAQPSVTESYSFAVAEALANGVPVVLTEGAGPAPDVRRHECGSVVPVDDEAALVTALREYTDPAVRHRRGRNARAFARNALDLPVLRQAMTRLYRDVARA